MSYDPNRITTEEVKEILKDIDDFSSVGISDEEVYELVDLIQEMYAHCFTNEQFSKRQDLESCATEMQIEKAYVLSGVNQNDPYGMKEVA